MDIENLKEKLNAVNDYIYFDKEQFLREKTSHPSMLKQVISQAECLLEKSSEQDKYFLNGVIGNLCRINGQPQKAIRHLTYCLHHAVNDGSYTKEIVARIRLGEAFKYNNHHDKAMDCFNKALDLCEIHSIDEYIDFALQHKAKCLMELEKVEEAEECLQITLSLRQEKGDSALIQSTKQAIHLVNEMKTVVYTENSGMRRRK